MTTKTVTFTQRLRYLVYLLSMTVSAIKIIWWRFRHALPRFKTFLLFLITISTAIFLLLTLLFYLNLDPDRGKSTCELVTSRHFACEVHHVTTYQSYIVELHRIPNLGKPVVILQTGLIGTSADFVIGEERMILDPITRSKSLAFELSRAGYDVWLSNNRGSIYGRGHQSLSSESGDPQFWKFSFDEIARYDVPAVIDYVLNQTKQENLHYIGHSQGAATMFALLSETSSVNRKLASFTAISPVTRLGKASTSFQLLLKILKPLLYSSGEVFGQNFFSDALLLFSSELPFVRDFAEYVLFSITGPDYEQFDKSRLGVLLSHMPTSTSAQNLLHFDQLFSTGRFAKFDHGLVGNLQLYGSLQPPQYNLTSITFSNPLTVIYSDNDWFVPVSSVEALREDLNFTNKNSNVEFYLISRPNSNHLDPLIGREVALEVNQKILKVLNRANKSKF